MAKEIISQYLDTLGTGLGTTNATGNYSSSAEIFYFEASRGETAIERMIVSIEDGQNMRAEHYGTLGGALTNGVIVRHVRANGDVLIDFTGGVPVTQNGLWGSLCYDVDVKAWGAGNELLLVRWTFAKSGIPVKLLVGDRLEVVLNDNFTGLVTHRFLVQGFWPA